MKARRRKLGESLLILAWLALSLTACAQRTCLPPVQDTHPPRPSSQPAQPSASGSAVVEQCLIDPAASRTIIHEVGPLETIWRISKMYGVTTKAIYSANNLKPGEPLRIGQKLVIPSAKGLRNVIPLYPSSKWKYIIVHHTATDIGKALQVHRAHEDRGFWNGLGYHFLIDNGTLGKGDGQIEVSPRWIKQQDGAHCQAGGMNKVGIGIALVGNFNLDHPTQNQLQSLTYLLRTLMKYYRISPRNVMGHRDVEGAATDCPGKQFPWQSIRPCLTAN